MELHIQYDRSVPSAAYGDLARGFASGLDRLERGFGAPPASEQPIVTQPRDLVPGYPGPEPSPLYTCPKCGQQERALRLLNAFRVLLGVTTSECKVPLFQSKPQ